MREIKFRIMLDGKWYYWGFIKLPSDKLCFAGIPNNNKKPLTMEELRGRSQQFTGLLDRCGREIYEGDFLSHITKDSPDFPQGEVVYRDGGFVGNWIGSKAGGERLYPRLVRHFEVVVNRSENPELMKVNMEPKAQKLIRLQGRR